MRVPQVVANLSALQETAEQMRGAVISGDVARVGTLLSKYWVQKKVMAPDAQPALVTRLMALVEDECHGMSLAGAGGGGFLVLITKQANAAARIRELVEGQGDATVHEAGLYTGPILP